MNPFIRGGIAAFALCALLAACGGGGGGASPPTTLPASVSITANAQAETGSAQTFSTNLVTTSGVTFQWNFGDGGTGSGASVSHTYATSGSYQVALAVSNSAQDQRSTSTSIQVGAYSNVSGLNCTQPNAGGWCWQHALATGHGINEVFFIDASHAWAVGAARTLLESSDGGADWTQVALAGSTAMSLTSVRFYDPSHGMVLGDDGTALLTRDGGATWSVNTLGGLVSSDGAASFVDFSSSRIIINSQFATVMSVDGGASWTPVGITGVAQATATDCWGYGGGGFQRAAACGATAAASFTLPTSGNFWEGGNDSLVAEQFSSSTQGLVIESGYSDAFGSSGSFGWSTTDGGVTWNHFVANGLPVFPGQLIGSTIYGPAMSLHMNDALTGSLYTLDVHSTLYDTQDGGHNWTLVPSAPLPGIDSPGALDLGFVGNTLWESVTNNLAVSSDRGQTWHVATVSDEASSNLPNVGVSVSLAQYSDVNDFVVMSAARYYGTHDGGRTFIHILGPDARDIPGQFGSTAAGDFLDAKHGIFATSRGAILSTTDGGRNWSRAGHSIDSRQPTALHFNSKADAWLLLDGQLQHSTDGGASWPSPTLPAAMTGLQGMSWGDAMHGWAWGSNGLMFGTGNGGQSWTQVLAVGNPAIASAVMTGALTGAIRSASGSCLATHDGGSTWQVATGDCGSGNLLRGAGQTVWASPGYRSKDGGLTWAITSLAGSSFNTVGLAFADALHGWAITGGGLVLYTADGGDTWSQQYSGFDIALVAIVAVDTKTAWIMTDSGQILATATGGV